MNDLQIFNYESNEVRTIMKDGEPWFCLVDVCRVLDLSSPHKVAERLDPDEKGRNQIPTPGGKQDTWFINESGLYNVILRSDKPEAKPFRKWVTGTVLPTIRKTGTYSTNALPDPKAGLAEAKVKNARARVASIWLKLAQTNPIPTFQQICAHYASAELTGGEAVLPLPEVKERTYSAAEVGELLGGISANMIGRVANQHGLKTDEYGIEVWDKSKHSAKQVPTWRYNEKAVARLRELLH
ncbi:toxin Bro [Colidextribacter sp. OB.20]|uniref:BRO-N domain-containing protein n=1 Tax=Colidextribacter sp. OB.20 TaxID=2304568 RepID=UPI0013715FD3|nr:Bro-N domain-containing protein [Colidextribacter sp. OB.20]NBI10263.1 toxin Bro [Colidextribacter sp. OB.20]